MTTYPGEGGEYIHTRMTSPAFAVKVRMYKVYTAKGAGSTSVDAAVTPLTLAPTNPPRRSADA